MILLMIFFKIIILKIYKTNVDLDKIFSIEPHKIYSQYEKPVLLTFFNKENINSIE